MTRPGTVEPRLVMWPVERIRTRRSNPRTELRDIEALAESIRRQGLIEPLVVEQVPPGSGGQWVTLVAGHRRLAAITMLGWDKVPVIPRWVSSTHHATILALVENTQRADLDPIDEARAYQDLLDTGMSARAVSRATGIPEGRISERLQLLHLDPAPQARVAAGTLSVTHAVAAVRTARRQTRTGRSPSTSPAAPAHFGPAHPLARRAAALCDTRQHPTRGRIGRTACGACWEHVIRLDQDQRRNP